MTNDLPSAEKRPLRIYAFDPMASRSTDESAGSAAQNRVTITVANEALSPGPIGERIAVVDYDASQKKYYAPVDLDHPSVLMRSGLDPTENDPRFHQQMVYAVTQRTLELFDRALGRRLTFKRRRSPAWPGLEEKLVVFPHAFEEANAYFDPGKNALLFGYFTAESDAGGPFVPGQTVFTCLSADVVAHEMAHALIHRMRPHFNRATNADVGAFHEGFADVVAIFQHFTYPDVLRRVVRTTAGRLTDPGPFVDLARQFGWGTGGGEALRTAMSAADPSLYLKLDEPHDRGALFVSAVFDAFFRSFRHRSADLIRIGTMLGSGGDLHPDLTERIAREAEQSANRFLTMCIRAFEYLPPVDIMFGDFVRAAVTIDRELHGDATAEDRELLADAFRRRGIYPDGVRSLSEDSLVLSGTDLSSMMKPLPLDKWTTERGARVGVLDPAATARPAAMHNWAKTYALELGMDPDVKIALAGFHSSIRVATDGSIRPELVAQFVQEDHTRASELDGSPMLAGATVIADVEGKPRYVVTKPTASSKLSASHQAMGTLRLRRQAAFTARRAERDGARAWAEPRPPEQRDSIDLRALHSRKRAER